MTDLKISQLVPVASAQATDVIPIARSSQVGQNLSVTAQQIANLAAQNGIYYPAMTTAAINTAMITASQAGGGLVQLQPGTYAMSGPLIPQPGVSLQGTIGFGFTPIPTFEGFGTILTGDGTFNGLQYNSADLTVEPTNAAAFIAGMCPGFSVMDITFSGFLYGIKLGGLYNPGLVGGNVININCINCQAWGLWLENFFHCGNAPTNAYCTGNVLGQVMLASSGGTACQNGNSYANNVVGSIFSTSLLTRGLVLCARGISGVFNQYILNFVGAENEGKTATTQSNVVMSSGSANIGITNSALFIPDQPVVFTGTVTNSGFQLNTTYFVVASAANVLQVSALIGGTAIQATGVVSGLNLVSYGFPGMEVIGYQNATSVPNSPYTGTHATVQAGEVRNLDIEAQSGQFGSLIIIQQVRDTTFTFNTLTDSPAVASVVHRGSSAEYFMRNSPSNLTFDIDTTFGNPTIFGTRSALGQSGGSSTWVGGGQSQLSIDAVDTRQLKNAWMLYLSGIGGPELKFNKNSYATEFAGFPIALPSTGLASGTTIPAQTFGYTSSIVYTTVGNGTLTLPVIPANGEGELYCVSNPSTGICTVSSQSSQAIIGASVNATSYAIPAYTDVYFRSCLNGATLYWAVIGIPTSGGLAQNVQTANYVTVANDANNLVSMNGSNLTATIAANASVAYVNGTMITFDNQNATNLSIAINSDTLILAGSTTTGTRTLVQNGTATALKTGTTTWKISGTGLT